MEHTLLFLLLLITLPLLSMNQNDQPPIHSLSIRSQFGKLLDDKKLKKEKYYLYKDAIDQEDRIESIENIKSFHEKHGVSYDEKYHTSIPYEGYDPKDGEYPIDWALRWNEPDFALFLLKNKKVDVKNRLICNDSKIHYLARGINKDEFNDKHSEILTLLIESKVAINSINDWKSSPLGEHINQSRKYKFSLNNRLLKSFFAHGAQLIYHEEIHHGYGVTFNKESKSMRSCNLLVTVLNEHNISDSKEGKIIAIAMLLKERLACAKKSYFDRLLIFKVLNEKFMTTIGIIPKPIRHMIINMAAQQEEAFTDIRESISREEKIVFMQNCSAYSGNLLNYSQPLHTVVKESIVLRDSQALCAMLSLEFWNRSLSTCLENLDSIIQKSRTEKENQIKEANDRMLNHWRDNDFE